MLYHTLHLKCIKFSEGFSQVKNLVWLLQLVFFAVDFQYVWYSPVTRAARVLWAAVFICVTAAAAPSPVRAPFQGQKQDIFWSFIAQTTDPHLSL